MKCERCITDSTKCIRCSDNPIYAHVPKTSQYTWYTPVCHLGYNDCIHDPGYIKAVDPKWYEELYGKMEPEDAEKEDCANCTNEHCYYDDENK